MRGRPGRGQGQGAGGRGREQATTNAHPFLVLPQMALLRFISPSFFFSSRVLSDPLTKGLLSPNRVRDSLQRDQEETALVGTPGDLAVSAECGSGRKPEVCVRKDFLTGTATHQDSALLPIPAGPWELCQG